MAPGAQDGDSEGDEGDVSVELPLIGEVPVPDFLANLLGMEASAQGQGEQGQGGQGQSRPTAVVFQTAEPQAVGESFRFLGRVAPIERVEIRARISGYVEDVGFQGGESVSEGDLLFRIQSAQYDAQLASARASLASAEAARLETERQLTRNEELRDSGTVSQAGLDDATAAAEAARAQVDQAQAMVQQAELDLSYTTIEAPIDGKISAPLITRGNFVSPSSEVMANVVQVDPIWGVFSLGENRLLEWTQLGIGGVSSAPIEGAATAAQSTQSGSSEYRLSLQLPDGSTYQPAGEFSFVGNEVDPQTGTVELRVRFANPDGLLLPNQNVSLLVSEIDPPVLPVVPQAAVQLSRDGRAVWVVRDDDTVTRMPVEVTQAPEPGQVAITRGLDGGERVIVRGALQLEEGQTVDPRMAGGQGGTPGSGGSGSQGSGGSQDSGSGEQESGGDSADSGDNSTDDDSGESDAQ